MGTLNALTDLVQAALIIFIMIMGILMTRRISRLESHAVVRYHELPSAPEDPKPICGCEHHQCFHDENGCGATTQPTRTWVSTGSSVFTEPRPSRVPTAEPCGCKRYTGPEALPTVLP